MLVSGNLKKMVTEISDEVKYYLPIGDQNIFLNECIGQNITLKYNNIINCISCGTKTKKSFGQGFCYNCFISAPEASECILKPDQCKAHLGISRNMEWSLNHCLTDHFVYLASSSNIKVGITRHTQIPTRWIDQGASEAIIIAKTPNRHIAGTIEKFLMNYYSDKTSWQAMLKGVNNKTDLISEKKKAISRLPKELSQYITEDKNVTKINYPINSYPDKIKSLTFDKVSRVEGVLTGIKGQYLYINKDQVINIRKHTGYFVEINI